MSTDTLSCMDIDLSISRVSPSDQLITLTLGQIQDLIQEAIERATAPLVARLEAFQARLNALEDVTGQRHNVAGEEGVRCREGEEPWPQQPKDEGRSPPDATRSHIPAPGIVQDLQAENHALKRELEAFQEYAARERALDRQRIAKLEQGGPARAPGTKTEARIKALREILKQRGSTTFKELERILKISPREMLRLTKELDMRQYEIFRRQGDAREKVIRLRSQISN